MTNDNIDSQPQHDFTNKQTAPDGKSKWAVFLPAISGFYATFIGKQKYGNYVDPARFPAKMNSMDQLNWLDSKNALFPYKWSLYSAGHANLDLSVPDANEEMVRNREPGTFILADSGGYQIGRKCWPGEWKDPTSQAVIDKLATLATTPSYQVPNKRGKLITINPLDEYKAKLAAAQVKRDAVLKWIDSVANYGMVLDIPSWVVHDKKAEEVVGIATYNDAVAGTKYNNLYFIKHRKGVANGGAKFLNVLQGSNHTQAEDWYQQMKEFCDPALYPDKHFDGWAMGGQNMCDVDLVLKRLVALRYDNLLQQGKHDWMHFLGTSKLEWAVLLTVIQTAVRNHVNPDFTISYDCASPFLATANGQVYHQIDVQHGKKWSYRMSPSIDDKKYATDNRQFSAVAMTDFLTHFKHFDDSPITTMCEVKDICIYKPGDLNKIGKEGKTSWDSFSYALQMGHNVWLHLESVQRANEAFTNGIRPPMMQWANGNYAKFEVVVEEIFNAPDRESALKIINDYSSYWMEIIGTRGFKGKKALNATTKFDEFFVAAPTPKVVKTDDGVKLQTAKLTKLEKAKQT